MPTNDYTHLPHRERQVTLERILLLLDDYADSRFTAEQQLRMIRTTIEWLAEGGEDSQ